MAISFNYPQYLISVTHDTLSCQDLINAIREQEASAIGVDYPQIATASGKEDLGSGVAVGMTVNLLEPWQVKFLEGNYIAKVAGGNLVGGLGGDPIAYSAGVQVLLVQSAASTIVTTSTGSGLSVEEHDKLMGVPTAPANATAVWNELKSNPVANGSYGDHVKGLTSTASAVGYLASSVTRVIGSDQGGTFETVQAHDDNYFSTGEVAGQGLEVIIDRASTTVTDLPQTCRISGYYAGSTGHSMAIQVWNYLLSAWEAKGAMLTRSMPFDYAIPLTGDHHDQSTGAMRVRLVHSTGTYIASHRLHLDYVVWTCNDGESLLSADLAAIKNQTDQMSFNMGRVNANAQMVSDSITAADNLETNVDAPISSVPSGVWEYER